MGQAVAVAYIQMVRHVAAVIEERRSMGCYRIGMEEPEFVGILRRRK